MSYTALEDRYPTAQSDEPQTEYSTTLLPSNKQRPQTRTTKPEAALRRFDLAPPAPARAVVEGLELQMVELFPAAKRMLLPSRLQADFAIGTDCPD